MTFLWLNSIWFLWLYWAWLILLLSFTIVWSINCMPSIGHPRLWRLHWRTLRQVRRRLQISLWILRPGTLTRNHLRMIESLNLSWKCVIILNPGAIMIDGIIEKPPPIPPLINTLIIRLSDPLLFPRVFMFSPDYFLSSLISFLPIERKKTLHIVKSWIESIIRASLNIFLLSTKYPFLGRCSISIFILYFLIQMTTNHRQEINKILSSNNHYEVLGLTKNANKQ